MNLENLIEAEPSLFPWEKLQQINGILLQRNHQTLTEIIQTKNEGFFETHPKNDPHFSRIVASFSLTPKTYEKI